MSEYVGKIKDLPEAPGNFIENASKKVVFGPLHFWSDYVMRCFDLKPGAGEKVEYPVKRWDWVHVPGEIPHYNYNSSETENFCFLCIVPPEGDVSPLLMGKGC